MSSKKHYLIKMYEDILHQQLKNNVPLEEAKENALNHLYNSDMLYSFTNLMDGETEEAQQFREQIWTVDFYYTPIRWIGNNSQ